MGEDNQIEIKLNIEKEILDLSRQKKLSLHQSDEAKKEYHSIVASIEKNKAILDEYKTNLTEVINDISNAKLSWAIEKENEWQKVSNKITEAENVIKREKRLNEQEIELREIESKTVEARNEQRQLELKNEANNLLNEDIKKQLDSYKVKFEEDKNLFIKEKENFKKELSNFISKWLQKL